MKISTVNLNRHTDEPLDETIEKLRPIAEDPDCAEELDFYFPNMQHWCGLSASEGGCRRLRQAGSLEVVSHLRAETVPAVRLILGWLSRHLRKVRNTSFGEPQLRDLGVPALLGIFERMPRLDFSVPDNGATHATFASPHVSGRYHSDAKVGL